MKKYIRFLLVLVLLASCEDALDRGPIDTLDEEVGFLSVPDLVEGVDGFLGNYDITDLVAFNSIFTDNTERGADNGGQELNTLNQILNPDGGDRGLWVNRYRVINDINRIFAAAEVILPDPANATEVAQYDFVLAQSYAFRALAHYELLLYYGFDITDRSAAGVPYQDYVSLGDVFPPRNSVGEVLDAINDDLDAALANMTSLSQNINYANEDFVTFLRARIALETANYDNAIDFSSDIIDNYNLATPAQYFAMFNEDADVTEVIWRFNNVQGFNYNLAGIWIFTGTDGDFIEASFELNSLLNPNDVRSDIIVNPNGENNRSIGKYPPNANRLYINDFKAMRVSEAYLIRAEAHARNLNFEEAENDLFAVRSARIAGATDPSYTNLEEAIADIIAERRLELAFEGHRYTDIKRVRDVLNVGIERIASDCPGATPCELPVDSEKWIFPIPTNEINANPNLAQDQAPGY